MSYASQALNHKDLYKGNPYEDVFSQFPLHPYMDGLSLPSGGRWQAGDDVVIFGDGSKLTWTNSRWEIGMFDLEESLKDEDEIDSEAVKNFLSSALMELAFNTALAEVRKKETKQETDN